MSEEDDTKTQMEMARIRARVREIANASSVPPPEEEVNDAKSAARDSLEHRAENLRRARAEKWDAKVPPRWNKWSMDQLPGQFQVVANQWIAEGFPNAKNFILCGPTGSGKTTMAYAVGREIYLLGSKVKMWNTAELFDEMRSADQAKIILDSVKGADLLLLDDLGSERKTDWVEERLFLIIDHRWQWELPIIVTTNLLPEEFSSAISERIVSRLLDGATQVNVGGKDYRA